MKTYTIIGGINGVGKSSFTGLLKEQRRDLGIIIDVDKLTAELGGNALAGGRGAVAKIQDCLDRGITFTQETGQGKWFLCPTVLYWPGQPGGKLGTDCQSGKAWRP